MMGKSLVWIRVALLCTLTACSMYGAPAPKLRTPEPIKNAGLPGEGEKPAPPIYDESDCELRTASVPKYRADKTRAVELTRIADKKIETFETATDPEVKGDMLAEGIADYGRALEKDAFSAEATLKLALAYDKAHRKACALTMLRRLSQLAENPTFERAANDRIDAVMDPKNKSWFEGYRKDARRAVGR
jgi:hypothetical protein